VVITKARKLLTLKKNKNLKTKNTKNIGILPVFFVVI
jgi:hypothetical protein